MPSIASPDPVHLVPQADERTVAPQAPAEPVEQFVGRDEPPPSGDEQSEQRLAVLATG